MHHGGVIPGPGNLYPHISWVLRLWFLQAMVMDQSQLEQAERGWRPLRLLDGLHMIRVQAVGLRTDIGT